MDREKVMKYLNHKIFYKAEKTMFMSGKDFDEMIEVLHYLKENLK